MNTEANLESYLVEVLARRPREWNCCRFMAGWLARSAPGTARVLACTLPRPETLTDAHIQFIKCGIHNAATYHQQALKYARGKLMLVHEPVLGDLAFIDSMFPEDTPYPSGGIVGDNGDAVFLNRQGGLMPVSTSTPGMLFARAQQ